MTEAVTVDVTDGVGVAPAVDDGVTDTVTDGVGVTAAVDEDVDLVGLNIGGHIDVAIRSIKRVQEVRPSLPIFAGGTIPPHAAKQLQALGVEVYPPGSQLADIVDAAERLTGTK